MKEILNDRQKVMGQFLSGVKCENQKWCENQNEKEILMKLWNLIG